ncbi:MAG: metal-dependent hydrolase [Gammaproteobacteria bacterium]|nr:metal-dependent hydrolase [Gammaproteobacteria bacterium]
MPLLSHTPDNVSIKPRNREYAIAQCLGKDWFDDHAFKTAWFNSMSILFPLGEKFFIDSVRHYAKRIEDPKLQEEIRGFCGQEGYHRREHQRYNETLCAARGYDLALMEGRLQKNLDRAYKFLSARQRLAGTAAVEHITAIMAESELADENPMIQNVDPTMKQLWDWHAAEEMEHKAVAFDVYRAIGGTEKMRKGAMRRVTVFLMLDVLRNVIHMLRCDGKLWNLRLWAEGVKFLFGKDGILRRVGPAYKDYFREGFHPWDRDTRHLLQHWNETDVAPQAAA